MDGNKKLLFLPGDGIGPEVVTQVRRLIDWMDQRRAVTFDIEEHLIGGSAIDEVGIPLPDETLAAAKNSDAILMGAVGGPSGKPSHLRSNLNEVFWEFEKSWICLLT